MTCVSLLKKTLESKFKVILNQIRKYNQEALVNAYKTQLSKTIHTLLSCYENLAFVTILSQNFYGVKKWTNEGLSFLANAEKGYLGFHESKSRRIKVNLTKSFSENFKKGGMAAEKYFVIKKFNANLTPKTEDRGTSNRIIQRIRLDGTRQKFLFKTQIHLTHLPTNFGNKNRRFKKFR
jgi:hypothetical protein